MPNNISPRLEQRVDDNQFHAKDMQIRMNVDLSGYIREDYLNAKAYTEEPLLSPVDGEGDNEASIIPFSPLNKKNKLWNRIVSFIQKKRKKNFYWQFAADKLNVLAEASNVGIVIQGVGQFFPIINVLSGGLFLLIAAYADPMIYLFRFLIRVVRVVGRERFNIVFDEEEKGRKHPRKTRADIICGILLLIAVPLFFVNPVAVTVGWTLAFTALTISSYFDYVYPARIAFKGHEQISKRPFATDDEKRDAYNEYYFLMRAKQLFFGMLVSVAVLAISSSIAVFAPPAIVPLLALLSQIASISAILVACARYINGKQETAYLKEKQERLKNTACVQASSFEANEPVNALTTTAKMSCMINEKGILEEVKEEKEEEKIENATVLCLEVPLIEKYVDSVGTNAAGVIPEEEAVVSPIAANEVVIANVMTPKMSINNRYIFDFNKERLFIEKEEKIANSPDDATSLSLTSGLNRDARS